LWLRLPLSLWVPIGGRRPARWRLLLALVSALLPWRRRRGEERRVIAEG